MSHLHRALGIVIRDRRRAVGLSQERLATQAGIHRTYISAVELGKVRLGIAVAKRIANGLNLPLATLIAEAEAITSHQANEEADEPHD